MQSVRVVHFGYADLLPGAARASYRLHRALLAEGADSRMVVWRRDSDDPTVDGPGSRMGAWTARYGPLVDYAPLRLLQPERREVSLAWMGSGRVRRVSQLRPDVVHLHWITGGLVRPAGLAALRAYPLVWRLPDMWAFTGVEHYAQDLYWRNGYASGQPAGGAQRLDRLAWRRKERAYARLPSLTVVAPSNWLAAEAERSPLLKGRRIEVIHTGVDTSVFSPQDVAQSRRRWDLPLDGPLVLFGANGGGLNPRKGYIQLLVALERLAASWRSAPGTLVIFGEEGETAQLAGWQVHRVGGLSVDADLATLYSAADVFVAPSLAENLANTVLESLACGTPVAAFAVGGMPDAIAHRKWGWLAKPADPDDLARGIVWLLERAAEGPSLREAARAAAQGRFDLRRQAQAYLRLYQEVLDRPPVQGDLGHRLDGESHGECGRKPDG